MNYITSKATCHFRNYIGDQGATDLAKALITMNSLTTLSLDLQG